jgi:hypothetical protein
MACNEILDSTFMIATLMLTELSMLTATANISDYQIVMYMGVS